MRTIIALIALTMPAAASGYMQTCTSIALSESLCGYEIPQTVKTRFLGYVSTELGIDGEAASHRVRSEADRIAEVARQRGTVKQTCEDLKLFVALAHGLR